MEGINRYIPLALIVLILILPVSADDWPKFRHDLRNTGIYKGGSSIDYANLTPAWIFETDSWIRSSPAVGDLDGDDKLEVVFGSDKGFLYVLDWSGRGLWSFRAGGRIRSSPAIADINRDGVLEILFGSDDGLLYVLNQSGGLLWSFKTGDAISSSPVAVDLDYVPGLEVVFGSMDGNLYLLDHEGDLLRKFELKGSVESSPAIADFDGDGKLDVIVGTNSYNVYVLSHPEPKKLIFSTGGRVVSSPVIVGSTPRIVVGSDSGEVYSLTCSKYKVGGDDSYTRAIINSVWNYSTGGGIFSSPAAANMVGSDDEEVIVGSGDRNLYIFDSYTGELLEKYMVNAPIYSSPAIADFDGDGKREVVFGSDDGILYMMNSSWDRVWSYKCKGAVRTSPVIADLDNDGNPEIIVGSDGNILYVFGSTRDNNITADVTAAASSTTSTLTSTTSTTSTSTSTTSTSLEYVGFGDTTTTWFVKPEVDIVEVGSTTTLGGDGPPSFVGRVVGVSVDSGLIVFVFFLASVLAYTLYRRRLT